MRNAEFSEIGSGSQELGSRNSECGIEKNWEVGMEKNWEVGMRKSEKKDDGAANSAKNQIHGAT